MKPVHIANQDGISILEVLIAMIILSMALLLLLNMAMVALDGNDWSNKTTVATQMLQEKLEQLRVLSNGYKIKVVTTPHRCEGVDTPDDFERFLNKYSIKKQ